MISNKYAKMFCITGPVIVLDQISKAVVLKTIPLYSSIPVIPGFLSITHLHNTGGAFGFMADQNSNLRNVLFIAASFVALSLVIYFYKNTPEKYALLATGFALIFGGACGNLADRIRMGKVVDFIDVYIGELHWPAFNIADSAISIGVFIFLYHLVFKKIPE